jgi:hypothetical protein
MPRAPTPQQLPCWPPLTWCRRSPGAATAAAAAAVAAAAAAAIHTHRMEALDNCQLDIMLLYEVVLDDVMKVMFPINSMRNYALLQARTPLVAMVDVDLIVSNALLQWLLDRKK